MKKHLFIGGQEVSAEHYEPLRSPYSGEIIATIAQATVGQLDDAIASAQAASTLQRKLAAHERALILSKVAQLLEEHKDEAAKCISLEVAKPLKQSYIEVERTIQTYLYAAEEAKRLNGEMVPMGAMPGGEGRLAFTIREPIGVVGAITPFNFPMNLVAHKIGPAIAAGNTVVLKPAPQTPLSAFFIGELFKEAGLPDGVLNIVTGDGALLGEYLVADPRVNMITFTGSPTVGKRISQLAGIKKRTLELGSNSAVIIDDEMMTEQVIQRCVTGAFSNNGQVCISLQRIYVIGNQYESFVEKLVEAASQLQLGDPLSNETDVSALISKASISRSLQWIQEAIGDGASLALGGKIKDDVILEPTIMLNVPQHSAISCQEVFAPIVIVNKVASMDEAIAMVNNSAYGLQAGVYCKTLETAWKAAANLQVGGVLINDIPTYRVDHMPYGGVKLSGTGKEGVPYAVEDMTTSKLIIVKV
ncbi:aldehyde dehydrogenase family protein [Paenibacillus endoradicis]|uniref:aldehyde dehydrogenase family protein n=1 Tax=Paenibacillus endoradicis TaxID=2972487 RepID=UPI0021598EA5|nr:aldehyde dehydrogenase family protein [Paenibacillus endoradicis]MCR8659511.1 aldehyde dehydrogenase family protein [Paenibacillus endoradicis]